MALNERLQLADGILHGNVLGQVGSWMSQRRDGPVKREKEREGKWSERDEIVECGWTPRDTGANLAHFLGTRCKLAFSMPNK